MADLNKHDAATNMILKRILKNNDNKCECQIAKYSSPRFLLLCGDFNNVMISVQPWII